MSKQLDGKKFQTDELRTDQDEMKSEKILKYSGSLGLKRNQIRHRKEFQDWFLHHFRNGPFIFGPFILSRKD